jgi:hypothetical protein
MGYFFNAGVAGLVYAAVLETLYIKKRKKEGEC